MRHLRLPLLGIAMLGGMFVLVAGSGCARGPAFVPVAQRTAIDRAVVDYPGGVVLEEVVRHLTAPVDCEIDADGNLIIAESGAGGEEPRIFGYRPDGTVFNVYPLPRTVRVPFDLIKYGFRIYGPVGGIAVDDGRIYVSHRDADGNGVITAFNYDGSHETVVANVPCRGDNGMSDVAIAPTGRLWFGVGSATNSGVVGLDNWNWVKKYPDFCDRSFVDLKLNGYHFKSRNPDAGIFGGPEIAVTAPFQPFNVSTQTRIRRSDFPTAALYSVDAAGGGQRVEAHGLRAPTGLTFSPFGNLYLTNQGMELRGTRPVKDDPDAFLRFAQDAWYGFPDYSATLQPITEQRFQPPPEMAIKSGYDEVAFLIDHNVSNNGAGLIPPVQSLLQATFPSLSGAARFDFVPDAGPLENFRGQAVVPLMGDRAPFATSGRKLIEPVGFKVVRVDPSSRETFDFIRNTKNRPASMLGRGQGLIERPAAVKFAPDGSMYLVDFGQLTVNPNGRVRIPPNTGRIFRLRPIDDPATQPASAGLPAAQVDEPSPASTTPADGATAPSGRSLGSEEE